jgi:molecular chaperone HscA
MLQEAGFAPEDMKARALVEARVDADRMLLATHSALDADGDVLSAAQRAEIDR